MRTCACSNVRPAAPSFTPMLKESSFKPVKSRSRTSATRMRRSGCLSAPFAHSSLAAKWIENKHTTGFADAYVVVEGYTLVKPRRRVASIDELSPDEHSPCENKSRHSPECGSGRAFDHDFHLHCGCGWLI